MDIESYKANWTGPRLQDLTSCPYDAFIGDGRQGTLVGQGGEPLALRPTIGELTRFDIGLR
jgi:hypothetical protein